MHEAFWRGFEKQAAAARQSRTHALAKEANLLGGLFSAGASLVRRIPGVAASLASRGMRYIPTAANGGVEGVVQRGRQTLKTLGTRGAALGGKALGVGAAIGAGSDALAAARHAGDAAAGARVTARNTAQAEAPQQTF